MFGRHLDQSARNNHGGVRSRRGRRLSKKTAAPANASDAEVGSGTTMDESEADSLCKTSWSIGLTPPAAPTLYCQMVQSLKTPVVEGWPVCASPKLARIHRSRPATRLSNSPTAKVEVA